MHYICKSAPQRLSSSSSSTIQEERENNPLHLVINLIITVCNSCNYYTNFYYYPPIDRKLRTRPPIQWAQNSLEPYITSETSIVGCLKSAIDSICVIDLQLGLSIQLQTFQIKKKLALHKSYHYILYIIIYIYTTCTRCPMFTGHLAKSSFSIDHYVFDYVLIQFWFPYV